MGTLSGGAEELPVLWMGTDDGACEMGADDGACETVVAPVPVDGTSLVGAPVVGSWLPVGTDTVGTIDGEGTEETVGIPEPGGKSEEIAEAIEDVRGGTTPEETTLWLGADADTGCETP